MECVCGYESDEYFSEEGFFIASMVVYYEDDTGRFLEKRIFICPKCGTLKVNL